MHCRKFDDINLALHDWGKQGYSFDDTLDDKDLEKGIKTTLYLAGKLPLKEGNNIFILNEKTKTITNREIYCDCWGLFILISKKKRLYVRDEFFRDSEVYYAS